MAILDAHGGAVMGGKNRLMNVDLLGTLLRTHAAVRYVAKDGTPMQGAVATVPGTDWTVVVGEPVAIVEAPAMTVRMQTLRVLLFSMVGALIVGIILARSLSMPVKELRDSALAVADGDYGHQTNVDRRDELGDLALAFNHMSSRLRLNQDEIVRQRAEIEAFNLALQRRVEQRTEELKKAQQQLVRSGQLAAVAQVGAGLAHELNNPLAGILGLTQLLRTKVKNGEAATMLGSIEEEAARCRKVVAAMLRFSSGEVDPKAQPVIDLWEVLRDVVDLVRGPFRQWGVSLELHHSDAPLLVRVDPVHGSRIFAQIFNALRSGLAEGATLRVAAHQQGDKIEVELRPDQPVFARDDWMASGLGLWVAHRLLDQLGGELEEPAETDDLDDLVWRVILPGA
ncbi:MAG: HAMP domain-containing protein [Proteobacteria bacterium]|nr:HAMP domain-containing protein [Pseudomonadota bacterium]